MIHQEFSWNTKDGKLIYAQNWEPEGEKKAAIALVHGLGEHSGRYQHVAEYFTNNGYSITALDLQGHGKTAGVRGHIRSYDAAMEDVQHLIEETRQRASGLPCFLYGHSMGGALVLFYALTRRPTDLAGVIATSPGLAVVAPPTGGKLAMVKVLNKVAPAMTMDNGLVLDNLSRDPQVKEKYVNDPLVHKKISVRLALELIQNGEWMVEHAGDLQVPLLLMQGTEDILVSPPATRKFAEKAAGDVTYKEWEGFYHEIHNEPEKLEVLSYMNGWMDAHLKKDSGTAA